MLTSKSQVIPWALTLMLGVVAGMLLNDNPPAQAQEAAKAAPMTHRYTVLETDGTNLLVTDNQTNTFYFYTIDQDAEIGSELKLRGTLDLNRVGQPTLKPEKPQ